MAQGPSPSFHVALAGLQVWAAGSPDAGAGPSGRGVSEVLRALCRSPRVLRPAALSPGGARAGQSGTPLSAVQPSPVPPGRSWTPVSIRPVPAEGPLQAVPPPPGKLSSSCGLSSRLRFLSCPRRPSFAGPLSVPAAPAPGVGGTAGRPASAVPAPAGPAVPSPRDCPALAHCSPGAPWKTLPPVALEAGGICVATLGHSPRGPSPPQPSGPAVTRKRLALGEPR